MKKRTLAILVPSLALVGFVGTGFGMYVVNQTTDIQDMNVQISMDSIMVNGDITVKPNGTQLKDVSDPSLGYKETGTDPNGSDSGYGFLRPFGVPKDSSSNNEYVVRPQDHFFAFDMQWKINSFINDFTNGAEIEWQAVSQQAANDPVYVPAFRNVDHSGGDTFDHAIIPTKLEMTLELQVPKVYTQCFDFGYGYDTTGKINKIDQSYWNVVDPTKDTAKDMYETEVHAFMNTGYSQATTSNSINAQSAADIDSSITSDWKYANMKNDVIDVYSTPKYTKEDDATNNTGLTTLNCFFGGFDCSIKTTTKTVTDSTGTTSTVNVPDYVSLIEKLNELKKSTSANDFPRTMNVSVKSIDLHYVKAETNYDAGGSTNQAGYKVIQETYSGLTNVDKSTVVAATYNIFTKGATTNVPGGN